MTNTTDIAQDILDRYDLGQHGRGDVELKDNVVRITMCAPSWKELTAVVPADATREQILQAICLTIFQYDPDIRTLIHLIEQGVDGLPDDIIDWLAEDGLPSADLWESLRFDRTGDPSRRIARSLSVAELKRLISMSVGEIGIHQWRDGYRTREMEERR